MSDFTTLPRFEEGHVPVAGGKLYYVSGGEGPQTAVLLHKLGGWTAEWRWIMPILATRMRVIAMDLPGHGGSTAGGQPPFIVTQEEVSAAVMAALDTLDLQKADMIGSSAGGCVSIVCAALWPERVSTVVSLGTALAGSVIGPSSAAMLAGTQKQTTATRQSMRVDAAQAIANGYFDENENPLPRDPSYMERVFGMSNPAHMEEQTLSRKVAGRWIQPASRGVALYDYPAMLPRIEAPVLLAYGDSGNYGRFTDAAAVQLKNSRIEAIQGASAFPHQDKPEETATLIMDFLGV